MSLLLPAGPFDAYLFDCDGTIVDSMPAHLVAWQAALAEHGGTFEEELFYAWGGRPTAEIVAALNARDGLAMPIDAVIARKEALYFERLDALRGVPDVLEVIAAHHGRLPFAVVSGSARDSVVASLTALGLLDRFATLVCAGDYARSKPFPEPFLVAAERLGVAPARCLVFEDTEMGVRSAEAAGMAWVRVPPPAR